MNEEDNFEFKEHQLAQGEAHELFVVQEANALILKFGPTNFINRLTPDARLELTHCILNSYNKRLTEATSGL